jgi:oxygen-independent coproporphyrinogen-3 oxidase
MSKDATDSGQGPEKPNQGDGTLLAGSNSVLEPETLTRLDVPVPRYTSYPTVPEWSRTVDEAAYRDRLRAIGTRSEPISLYVHIPFCRDRCAFCGCNVVVAREQARSDGYLDALEAEMDLVLSELGTKPRVSELHLGGGTPTFLDEERLARLFEALRSRFELDDHTEISVEIDPVETRVSQIELLASLGVRRISLGVQDLDPTVQEIIRRPQSVEITRELTEHARRLEYSSVNYDLIYGLPRQTPASWTKTLREVIELRPDRVAVYGFAFVPNMRPHQKALAEFPIPAGAEKLELFHIATSEFTKAGYVPLGMDHFALPEDSLSQALEAGRLDRSFMGYRVAGPKVLIGFGPSAIGDLDGFYAQTESQLLRWSTAVKKGKLPIIRGHHLSDDDRQRRAIITRLMCELRFDLSALPAPLQPAVEGLRWMKDEGLLEWRGNWVYVTEKGRPFVRNVAMVFDRYLEERRTQPGFSRAI